MKNLRKPKPYSTSLKKPKPENFETEPALLFRAVVVAKSIVLLAGNSGSAEVKKSEPVMTHQDESESVN